MNSDSDNAGRLARIEADIQTMKLRLDNDFRSLYGNGHPGLIDRHADLEKRLASHLASGAGASSLIHWIVAAATIACALYTAFGR